MSITETLSEKAQVPVTKKHRFAMLPEDVLSRKDITPGEKLLLGVMNMESYGTGFVALSDGVYGALSGLSRARMVSARRNLESQGLIEKSGAPIKQVQPYRLLHADMQGGGSGAIEPKTQRTQSVKCVGCARKCKQLGSSGLCRECVENEELPTRIAQAQAVLGVTATADEIAAHMKNRRLANKIRRIMAA